MNKYVKYSIIGVFFVAVIGMIIWADRPAKQPVKAMTAEQIEQQTIVQQIQSGSLLWKEAKAKEDAARAERIRQEQGNAGYRHTLCTKFQKIVNESGAVIDAQLSADGTSCIAIQGF